MSALSRLSSTAVVGAHEGEIREYPVATPRFELAAALLSASIIGGFVIDTWAHNHGRADTTFFTPWHALLYGAMAVTGLFLFVTWERNRAAGYAWQRAMPAGYGLSLAGVALFAVAGILDMGWHLLFGIEVSVDALLSPTHLLLAMASFLIVAGPLRSAWPGPSTATQPKEGWRGLAPALISATALLVLLVGLTQYAHPLVSVEAAKRDARQVLSDIYVMNADGSGQTRLTSNPHMSGWGPAFSPDGKYVAFTYAVPNTQVAELYLANADSSNPVQLTHNGRSNYLPAWSPDSKHISFISQVGSDMDTAEVYAIDADGRNERHLTSNDAQEYGTSWSPDGKRLAFGSQMGGTWNVYFMNVDGTGTTLLQGSAGGNAPAWSPDGSVIAFTSNREGNDNIYVMNAGGTGARRVTQGDSHNDNPVWSPDGKKIAFESTKDGNNEIYVMNADGTGAVNLTNNAVTESFIPTWSPDGKKIAYLASGHSTEPDPFFRQALGISSILLQSALLMGLLLTMARRWKLPLGALTMLIGLSSLAMVVQRDQTSLFPAALIASIAADLLYLALRPSADRVAQPWRFYLFAALVPAVFYALYFVTLLATVGVGWSVHMTVGAILLAGIAGLLVSFLVLPPMRQATAQAASFGDTDQLREA